jgi:hypothetical protein
MKTVLVHLQSSAPYSQSRQHDMPKLDRETDNDREARTWREKATYDANGIICIPAMALKQCLDATAKVLGHQIPGKGKSTYTKHFKAGVICESDVSLGVHKDEVESVTINANSDGVRGSGKRVKRTFPLIPEWAGQARFVILDDTVTKAVFERHMTEAGRFVGIGRFRPENGGLYGRFQPTKFEWADV